MSSISSSSPTSPLPSLPTNHAKTTVVKLPKFDPADVIELYDTKEYYTFVAARRKESTNNNVREANKAPDLLVFDDMAAENNNNNDNMAKGEEPSIEAFQVDRTSMTLRIIPNPDLNSVYNNARGMIRLQGILGFIRLGGGPYLIFIKEKELAAEIKGHKIYRIMSIQTMPMTSSYVPFERLEKDKEYLKMVKNLFSGEKMFYFSYTYDLTNSFQKFFSTPAQDREIDELFLWNGYLAKDLIANNLSRFLLPVILGFVQIELTSLGGRYFHFGVLSRKSCKRAGTRFNHRGIDMEANVANFVETEQFVISAEGKFSSFLNVRGSIPLFWEQPPNLNLKPVPVLLNVDSRLQSRMFEAHFRRLVKRYGRVIIIDLVKQHGGEQALSSAYSREHVNLDPDLRVKYISFDFHKECRKMSFENLKLWLSNITPDINSIGFFHMDETNAIKGMQTGIMRVNCIDCLDRTNVSQSNISRLVLPNQCAKLGIPFDQNDFRLQDFEMMFKNVWGNNGDTISIAYTGTAALMAEFTRTGKRTVSGLFEDGKNSLERYFKNNFTDQYKQACLDLVLGANVPSFEYDALAGNSTATVPGAPATNNGTATATATTNSYQQVLNTAIEPKISVYHPMDLLNIAKTSIIQPLQQQFGGQQQQRPVGASPQRPTTRPPPPPPTATVARTPDRPLPQQQQQQHSNHKPLPRPTTTRPPPPPVVSTTTTTTTTTTPVKRMPPPPPVLPIPHSQPASTSDASSSDSLIVFDVVDVNNNSVTNNTNVNSIPAAPTTTTTTATATLDPFDELFGTTTNSNDNNNNNNETSAAAPPLLAANDTMDALLPPDNHRTSSHSLKLTKDDVIRFEDNYFQ